ncbi:FAD-binding oxidoreductase [Variovorax sp. PAMC 28711]|uniref:FAD-binding oxidoreductase n=1 Tax=Variovorax sp. PAMC 28711 TaxID=1795631 RepID=UPI00078D44D2|nr:FAD-binding oxidoreductase [Variovorax sp. PAMC 28711]AMM24212.1 FAD-linked oxidase [Variovorax sp. PAMC 28711]
MLTVGSWGRYPHHPQTPHPIAWPFEIEGAFSRVRSQGAESTLGYGCGRSYGDSCLAQSDHVISLAGMDRLIAADWHTGIVTAQAGVTLDGLIRVGLPNGWFLPVTPGTKFVTLGGAVANDVHGKNHHVMGTFGRHVRRIVLYRSDTGVCECSPTVNTELFNATVGGLGLTGIILAVELQLRAVRSSDIAQTCIKFGDLDEFFALSSQHDSKYEYTVSWVDCLAGGKSVGRGHYIGGNHATEGELKVARGKAKRMPIDPPCSLVNTLTLKAFNTLYYQRQVRKVVETRVNYDPFFYPLDKLLLWNRMYGKAGFQQYQCVIPPESGRDAVAAILRETSLNGAGSFLAVLKQCADIKSPGLLSFPKAGVSLALDFAQHDALNIRLFARLDALVHEAGGRLYPAKDAHMSAHHFRQAYPAWTRMESLRDPMLMSRFWRRVTS